MSAHGQLEACVWQQSSEHGAIHESCQLFIAARGIAGRIEQEAPVRNIVSRPTIKKIVGQITSSIKTDTAFVLPLRTALVLIKILLVWGVHAAKVLERSHNNPHWNTRAEHLNLHLKVLN